MTPAEKASVIRHFLTEEKRRAHIAYEDLHHYYDDLKRRQATNPASVDSERIGLAWWSVERAKAVETYLGQALSGYPAVTP